jgi:hypothetical protein
MRDQRNYHRTAVFPGMTDPISQNLVPPQIEQDCGLEQESRMAALSRSADRLAPYLPPLGSDLAVCVINTPTGGALAITPSWSIY